MQSGTGAERMYSGSLDCTKKDSFKDIIYLILYYKKIIDSEYCRKSEIQNTTVFLCLLVGHAVCALIYALILNLSSP